MHLKSTATVALLTLLALPQVAQARALAIADLGQYDSVHFTKREDEVKRFQAGLVHDDKNLNHIDNIKYFGAGATHNIDHFLTSHAIIKGPKKGDPSKGDPDDAGSTGSFDPTNPGGTPSSGDNGNGGAFDPTNPPTSPPQDKPDGGTSGDKDPSDPTTDPPKDKPDDGAGGVVDPNAPPAKGDPSDGPTEKLSDEDRAELCARPGAGLRSRSLCGPGDGDDGVGGGGFDSEPVTAPVAGEAPRPKRETVKNWYDIVEMDNPPAFLAKDAFDKRVRGEGEDLPIADTKNKYTYAAARDKFRTPFAENADVLGNMWAKLGRTPPGDSVAVAIKSTPGIGRHGPQVNECVYSRDGRFIVARKSEREVDENDPKIPWDRLVYRAYKNQVVEANQKSLEAVGRLQITNKATKATIQQALRETGKSTAKGEDGTIGIATFEANAAEGSKEKLAFDAISRTDNVNGVFWLLSDHYDDLGKKSVTRIHVSRNSEDDESDFHMIVEIG